MARRSSISISGSTIMTAIIIIAVLWIGAKFFLNKKSDTYKDIPNLSISEFMENANSMRGNEYQVSGKVDEKFIKPSSSNLVVSVIVDEKGSNAIIPLLIPNTVKINIEREQKYNFHFKIIDGGVAQVIQIQPL